MELVTLDPRSARWLAWIALCCGWLLTLGVNTGRADCLPEVCCPPKVYVFRGVVGYHPKVDQFAEEIRCRGCEPVVLNPIHAPFIKHQITRNVRLGRHRGPILIVGYSLGAAAAATLCSELGKEGIAVDLLCLIECFIPANISPNVARCVNIYESRSFDKVFVFRGTAVASVTPCTQFLEIDIARHPAFSGVCNDLNHFNMVTCPEVKDVILRQLSCFGRQAGWGP